MNLSSSFSEDSEEVESEGLIRAIRWIYLAIVTIVFILGCLNLLIFLIKKGKWRTLPLLLMYISCQITLAFAIARLCLPS